MKAIRKHCNFIHPSSTLIYQCSVAGELPISRGHWTRHGEYSGQVANPSQGSKETYRQIPTCTHTLLPNLEKLIHFWTEEESRSTQREEIHNKHRTFVSRFCSYKAQWYCAKSQQCPSKLLVDFCQHSHIYACISKSKQQ